MKARRNQKRPARGNLFELAEVVSVTFGQPGAKAATEELREVAQDYRAVTKAEGQEPWLTYGLQLLMACPVLLQRPPGFEWVLDDLGWALHNRKFSAAVDRDFWRAMANVRGILTKGRPGNRARDFLRYQMVHAMMNPVTTAPGAGLIRTRGISKTSAVAKLAEREEQWYGRRPDPRVIWRSLQRVEDYLARVRAQLEVDRSTAGRGSKKQGESDAV